jgi:NMT1/THI5 like
LQEVQALIAGWMILWRAHPRGKPTTVAKEKGLFEKEGLKPEITIYRGGGETFEAIAARSADLGTVAVPLIATSRKRGVLTKIVAANGDEWSGWILGVKADSPIKSPKELDGKKVGITSSGSGSGTPALWAQSVDKVTFAAAPAGADGRVVPGEQADPCYFVLRASTRFRSLFETCTRTGRIWEK